MSTQVFSTPQFPNLNASVAVYAPVSSVLTGGSLTSTELNASQPWAVAGVFTGLVVRLAAAPGAGKSFAFTLLVNGVASALTATISDTDVTARDVVNRVTVAAGDRVVLRCVPTGTPTVPGVNGTRFVTGFVATALNESGYAHGATLTIAAAAGTRYAPLLVGGDWSATAANVTEIIPLAGTITALYLLPNAAISAANSLTCAIWLNGVKQDGTGGTPDTTTALTVGMTAASATFTLPVVPGDLIYLELVKVGTASTALGFGARFVAGVDGYAMYAGGGSGNMNQSVPRYNPTGWTDGAPWNSTESAVQNDGGVASITIRTGYVVLSGAPGAATQYAFALRVNTATPVGGPSGTIADLATTGILTGSAVVRDGDLTALQVTPTGTPTARFARWAFVQTGAFAPGSGALGRDFTTGLTNQINASGWPKNEALRAALASVYNAPTDEDLSTLAVRLAGDLT